MSRTSCFAALLLGFLSLAQIHIAFAQTPADPLIENGNGFLGYPSQPTRDRANPNDYLVVHPQYVLSYNQSKGGPNWVSWHLVWEDLGPFDTAESFKPDSLLPADWQLGSRAYTFNLGGYEPGLQCPAEERTLTEEDRQATYLMSNALPRTPAVNEGVLASLEKYCRTLVYYYGAELYLIAGGLGSQGKLAGGLVNVPAYCWEIALVVPDDDNDLAHIDAGTPVIAVKIPNLKSLPSLDWRYYETTVQEIEASSVGEIRPGAGYHFFANLPLPVQAVLKSKLGNGSDD